MCVCGHAIRALMCKHTHVCVSLCGGGGRKGGGQRMGCSGKEMRERDGQTKRGRQRWGMGAGEGGGERVGRRKRQMGKKERDGGERKGGRREKDHQPSSKAQDQESDDIIFIKCLGNYT